jgi:hypothetical protein
MWVDTINSAQAAMTGDSLRIIPSFDNWREIPPMPAAKPGVSITPMTRQGSIGDAYSRHVAIETIRDPKEAIICCDAHMSFPYGWDLTVEQLCEKEAFWCFRCPTITPIGHIPAILPENILGGYRGAMLFAYHKFRTGTCSYHSEALAPRWLPTAENIAYPCRVPCILGGAYAFSRGTYKKIGEPWNYLRGYGQTEIIVSLLADSWGIPCYCHEMKIGHWFRNENPNPQISKEAPINISTMLELFAWGKEMEWVKAEHHRMNPGCAPRKIPAIAGPKVPDCITMTILDETNPEEGPQWKSIPV